MVVGACRIVLTIPGNDSLKGKRSVVRAILDRTRARFPVSAAEVGRLDEHRAAELGFAVVSNERSHAQAMLDTLVSFVSREARGVVTSHETELISLGTFGDP